MSVNDVNNKFTKSWKEHFPFYIGSQIWRWFFFSNKTSLNLIQKRTLFDLVNYSDRWIGIRKGHFSGDDFVVHIIDWHFLWWWSWKLKFPGKSKTLIIKNYWAQKIVKKCDAGYRHCRCKNTFENAKLLSKPKNL